MALVTLAALIAIPYAIPGAKRVRLLSAREAEPTRTAPAASDSATAPVGSVKLADETTDHPELALPEVAPAAKEKTKPPPRPIEDPTGRAFSAFFTKLARVERKEPGTVARILHYGDSLLAVDLVASTLRRQMQERFGDAGHGYMPIANPTPGYFHNDVSRRASTEWMVSRVVGPFSPDGLYGLGGVSFIGSSKAAWARYATPSKGSFGRAVSRFGVQYLAQPNGGDFEILIDGSEKESISTSADAPKLVTWEKKVADGEHTFELRVMKGPVRAFGTWFDRDGPGVIVDSVGIQGARLRFLDQENDAHWAEALQSRSPDLVVFEFGLNEAADDFAYPMDRYKETALAVLAQVRAALPNASCLMVSPNDTAIKRGTDLVTRPVMPYLVKAQREVAEKSGCAFFDVYQAMGGWGSMAAWIRKGLGGPDYTHPTTIGADTIGTWLYRALMERYENWRETDGGTPTVMDAALDAKSD
ncbi:MAG: hypothetical protein HY898_32145 [Deltaproteobacteria bacterium]|nr:hypothetical protein [Deltaproteobacteria bacterium]